MGTAADMREMAGTLDKIAAGMLRSAFLALSSDAEFQAELDTLGYEFVPVPGVDLATFADELSETPDSLIEYINSITQ
jgi:hypothetical protein